jgi:hypothetical protein
MASTEPLFITAYQGMQPPSFCYTGSDHCHEPIQWSAVFILVQWSAAHILERQ